jgi:opacity protein-like surface antigen
MYNFLRIIKQFITIASLLLSSYSTVFAGAKGPVKNSNWYWGIIGSALWEELPSGIHISNGEEYPYNNDYYSVTNGTEGSVAFNLGYEWKQSSYWLPLVALGLQDEHFFLGSLNGTITRYNVPTFLNYTYSWDSAADLISIYSKINLVQYYRFSPFINIAIGWSIFRSSKIREIALQDITPRVSPGFGGYTQNNFAYNFGAGVDYALSKQWSASLAYNYQYLGSLRSSNGVSAWSDEYLNIKNYQINMLSVGVAYHFG